MPRPIARAWKLCALSARSIVLEFHAISAATGEGVRDLVRSIADALDKIPKAAPTNPRWTCRTYGQRRGRESQDAPAVRIGGRDFREFMRK